MNDIVNILIKHGCDAETIAKVVNEFTDVVTKYSPVQACIAMAVLLKLLAKQGCDDPDEQLQLFFALADCYDVNIN